MEILFQKYMCSSVVASEKGQLLAESTLVSTDYDAIARITADYYNYRINDAWWEICRSPGGEYNGVGKAPELVGVEAYLGAGVALRQAVGSGGGGVPLSLLSECVKAVLQAESFMFTDRGYPTPESYEEYWEEMYVNSCRYYSNLDRVNRGWLAEETKYTRSKGLFNRFLDCRVCRLSDGGIAVSGGFCDSAHELSVYLELGGDGVIIKCVGNFLRAPDPVCRENKIHIAGLMGKKPAELGKREIGGLLGGEQGCNHLVDLVNEMCVTVSAVVRL